MKTYNKTHCPKVIEYNGEQYKLDIAATHDYKDGVKLSSRYHIKVNVLSKNLKGRTDLHGKPYTLNTFIYSNELGLMRSQLPAKVERTTSKGEKIYEMKYPNNKPLD